MRKHIMFLLIGLMLLALLVAGLRSCDGKMSLPLAGNAAAQTDNTDEADGETSQTAGEAGAESQDAGQDTGETDENGQSAEIAATETEAANAAAEVDALIGEIGDPVTLEDKAAIEAARSAYDKLSEEAKAQVKDLASLEAAEQVLSELEAIEADSDESQDESAAGEAAQTAPENSASDSSYTVGGTVLFGGGSVYATSGDSRAAKVIEGESLCEVTYYAEDAAHPYHLVSTDGGGVYGWVDAENITEGGLK
ncbi:MAG: hypothetical protein Q4B42_05285 [Oscillospiraceae bacterium]|nr:hypothetical protein [Oscillospiraceae bacterium]